MPQQAKGPRLYRRKDTGIWIIRDTGRGDRSTGSRERKEAETALSIYLAERDRPIGPATASEMTVAEALNKYASEHAPNVSDPARIGYAIEALVSFWGERPLSAIVRETCKAYAKVRRKVVRRDRETKEVLETAPVAPGTIRRELGTLAAAITYCKDEGYVVNPPKVHLPEKTEPKDRWLTRDEAARLVWAAWRNPGSKHLARFILIGLYTGTRKTAILRMRFMPSTSGGWVDTERDQMYRRGRGETETKKKRPPIHLPRQLAAHLRRWEHNQHRWVIEYKGAGVGSIKTAWSTAVDESGLSGTSVTPHTLRHTAITWAMQAGADIWEAAGYFGVSIETMHRVYAHHHPEHQESAVKAMESRGRKL